ncbi:hypothetical protein JCM19240_2708 [Vibrio maritimus]|uniref:Uncharacterized protein n=1 Tax=Vibrio maritimus TaxID=990268 RepID=A0A090TD03_9VIBR|nr:hypothetical protein JCM19240_2708 [Vibrio maritimus]
MWEEGIALENSIDVSLFSRDFRYILASEIESTTVDGFKTGDHS